MTERERILAYMKTPLWKEHEQREIAHMQKAQDDWNNSPARNMPVERVDPYEFEWGQ